LKVNLTNSFYHGALSKLFIKFNDEAIKIMQVLFRTLYSCSLRCNIVQRTLLDKFSFKSC